jgi:pimeloyl-ACP methyl ester carboxylesterase
MPNQFDVPVRTGSAEKQALVFVHGFSGDAHKTFGMLPAFLAGDRGLETWDLFCFGYPTSLAPDISGVWAADPDLTTLTGLLLEYCRNKLGEYRRLALIAHSMGGLIAQQAVLSPALAARVSHLALFGTPSDGLRKATGLARILKRQARDMAAGGPFITQLRNSWAAKFPSAMPFAFRAVAGVRDEFVPTESSVKPFPGYEAYVNGNHLEIVKPEFTSSDTTVLLRLFLSAAPGASAAVLRTPARDEAEQTVDALKEQGTDLSDEQVVKLALALEMIGKQEESIALLRKCANRSTELTSVLAGRLKRRWLADSEFRAADGPEALALYRDAFVRASQSSNHAQAYYAGINVAFLELALDEQADEARSVAIRVLDHCRLSAVNKWQLATQAEAYLYLGNLEAALAYYAAALEAKPDMREVDSIQKQAVWAARLLKAPEAEPKLQKLFDSGPR